MTLSLDDVRNKRFRMARKSGYEVLEVDEFVDEVEATFEQLFEENQNLKKQVESLRATGATASTQVNKPAAATPAAAAPASAPGRPTERIVVTTGKEASSAVVRLVELSTEQAEQLLAEATAEAAQIREEATSTAERATREAHARAEKVETEARAHAERLQADALSRSDSVDREIENRRAEMFDQLERQRVELTATVHALRTFEATYRSNLTRHLQSQIEVLASGHEEPADPPPALAEAPGAVGPGEDVAAAGAQTTPRAPDEPASEGEDDRPTSTSETPRLDALLGDQR